MKRIVITIVFVLLASASSASAEPTDCVRCTYMPEIKAHYCDWSFNGAPHPNDANWGTSCYAFEEYGWAYCNVSGVCGYEPYPVTSLSLKPNFAAFLKAARMDADKRVKKGA